MGDQGRTALPEDSQRGTRHVASAHEEAADGFRTAWLLHPDGSWARAAATGDDAPAVVQSGPRRLWDLVDEIRHAWLAEGRMPVYGAVVRIDPDGGVHLRKGGWSAEIPAGT